MPNLFLAAARTEEPLAAPVNVNTGNVANNKRKEELRSVLRDDEEDNYGEGGCRPCCSLPHGLKAIFVCLLATIAWICGFSAVGDCHFLKPDYLYCHPPPEPTPTYGTCGDCHCINGNETCPSDPNEIPLVDVNDAFLRQLKNIEAENPYQMTCNPYNNTDKFCTNPPQKDYQIDLWETAVCGINYNMSTLDEELCPTSYTMETYDSKELLLDAGAEMTHWGACGACSTARDFAVYLEYPDLTGKGQECGARGLLNWNDGVNCFKEVGYTNDCAVMWMYNVQNTKDKCFEVCIDFTFLGDGFNNGPPPECKIANCLLCDEQMSGPAFQTVAARSRRRSGLLSKITRSCDVILIVDHKPPCNVTRDKLAAEQGRFLQSSSKIVAPEKWRAPEPTETCVYMRDDLGLRGYQGSEENSWLLPKALLATEDREKISRYDTCFSYEFDNVLSGFWSNQREIFGAAYNSAATFGVIGNVLGILCMICVWVASCCIAAKHRFWRIIAFLFIAIGACMFLTLTFFASDVCAGGCEIGASGIRAIVAGLLWWLAAVFAYQTGPIDRSVPKASCCCCPATFDDDANDPVAYSSVPVGEGDQTATTEVVVTETKKDDGTRVVEKVTTHPNGATVVERTMYKTDG